MKLKLPALLIIGILLCQNFAQSQCSVVLTPTNPTCNGSCNGSILATPAGGSAPYNYQWYDGLGAPIGTNSNTISGLCAGNYSVDVTDNSGASATFFTENFGTGCNQNNNANGTITTNGTWTVLDVGAPDIPPCNSFFISATEAGMGVGNCGDGCLGAGGTNRTLHVGNDAGSPAGFFFCPTGDCGAAYDASIAASKRAVSPLINCTGQTGISLSLEYIHAGEAGFDFGSIWYFDGAAWSLLQAVPQVLCCDIFGGPDGICDGLFYGQGKWNSLTVALPVSANNNANVRIGIEWQNNGNNVGTDPSLAVDNIQLSTSGTGCLVSANTTLTDPALPSVSATNNGPVCTGSPITLNETGGDAVAWSWTTSGGATITNVGDQSPVATSAINGETFTVTITDGSGCTNSAMTSIVMNPAHTLSSASTAPTCGNNDGAIDITVTGGSGNFSYSWDNLEITEDITNLFAGSYTITVTDNITTCVATLTVNLVNVGGPSITTVNLVDPSCGVADGSIEIIASGGTGALSYSIDNGVTFLPTNLFGTLVGGTYDLVVEDGVGCQIPQQVVLANANGVILTLVGSTNPSCGVLDGTIEVSSNGTGTEVYFINGVNSGATTLFTGLGPANYTILVSENGCTDQFDVLLSNGTGPTISSITPTDISCFAANDGDITIVAVGGTAPLDYTIDNGVINQTNTAGFFSALPPGTYDVTVDDISGCPSTGQTVIVEPGAISFTAQKTDIQCFGEVNGVLIFTNVTGGTNPLNYSINGGATTSASPIFAGLSAGAYNMVISDGNGCVSANQVVNIIEPAQLALGAVTQDANCFGACNGTVTVTPVGGTAPFTYTWNFGVVGNQAGYAQLICDGTYTVDVADDNGCEESIIYEIGQPGEIVVQILNVTDAGCEQGACDGEIFIFATNVANYFLDGNANPWGTYLDLCAGTYTLVAENAQGCSVSQQVVINNEEAPNANFGLYPGEMSLPDHSFTTFNNSTNTTNHLWTVQSENYDYSGTEQNLDLELPYEGANYEVCLYAYNQSACTDSMCTYVEVRDEFTLWVPNTFTPDADEFNNVFEPVVSDVDAQDYDFFVFNRWGEIIFESHDINFGWDGTYNGKMVESGTYTWTIRLKSKYTDELREYSGHVTMLM